MRITLIFVFLFLMMTPLSHSDQKIKEPNVSGQFYDADPKKLTAMIDQFLREADVKPIAGHTGVIISPHAGYIYSGGVAAYAFKAVSRNKYSTVIVLGPSHYYNFSGVSIWDKGGYKTPLGVARIDEQLAKKLMDSNKNIYHDENVFQREHSVEVEIPFVQRVFKNAKIVPMIMGAMTLDLLKEFVQSLQNTIGDRKDVLIVISSDMSHFHQDDEARRLDYKAAEVIKSMDVDTIVSAQQKGLTEIDGIMPILSGIMYANQSGLKRAESLKYGNSADVTGDRNRVVGYLAMSFSDGPPATATAKKNAKDQISPLSHAQRKRLIEIARDTVHTYVKTGEIPEYSETDPRLSLEEGAFVTIHKKGELRGCIGNIIGRGPLYETVRDMAVAAASNDPRFPPVSSDELKDIDVEVSVLSRPRVVKDVEEIQMGTHGVIMSQGDKSGVFLPQVATDTGWNREQFLSVLAAQKAKLKPDAWKDPKTKIEIFSADVFSEEDVE